MLLICLLWEPVFYNGVATHYRKFDIYFIDPERFANALYEYLKERES